MKADHEISYAHLLPGKPPVQIPPDQEMVKNCRRCGAVFVTRSRVKKRCDVCQAAANLKNQSRANEKAKAARAKRRATGIIPENRRTAYAGRGAILAHWASGELKTS